MVSDTHRYWQATPCCIERQCAVHQDVAVPLTVVYFGLSRTLVYCHLDPEELGDSIRPVRSSNGCSRGDNNGLGKLWLVSIALV